MEELVQYTSEDGVTHIRLNRPEKLNALSADLLRALREAWVRFEESEDVVGVFSGNGDRAFCAGADLAETKVIDMAPAVPNVGVPLSKPLIAAVHGHCIGGGYVLAQHCDLVVAADDTRFSYPEARLGFTGGIAASVAGRIPTKVAMEFLLLGEPIHAQRAYSVGMVNKVVPTGQHIVAAQEWAERLLLCAPLVVRALKSFVDEMVLRSPAEQAARTRSRLSTVNDTADRLEGAAAALEKRTPHWIGA